MNTIDSTFGAEESIQNKQPELLLSVYNATDRKLFKKFLPNFFTIEMSANGIANHSFDLCILDRQSFEANKKKLLELKKQEAPIFLPFLLLSPDRKTVRTSNTILEFADDVVYIPASPKLLQSRINILLKQREYSLKLKEKNRQLEEKNEELAEEKRKYQLITENSSDMISRHAPDGTYLYVSPACKELTGYEPEDLVGYKPFDNIHPRDRNIFENPEELFADKEVKRFSFRKGTINGDFKWVESIMRPIVDEETCEVIEIQASTRDISERKEFEQKLKEEKAFIDKAIQSLPELFYMIDEDQNFIKWNNIERVLGYSDQEMQNIHPVDLFREEDHEFITKKIQEVFEVGFVEIEVKIKSKSGGLIPHLVTARRFSRGEKNFIVGTGINLSEIKETQYELEQHRQLLDAIINQTKSLIYLKDSDRKYRLVNDSYLEFYDLKRDEIIGKTDQEVHGSQIGRVRETDYKVLESQEISEVEEVRSNKNDSRFYHTIKYPLKGVPGFENCMCGISTDITDLKQATNKLQERIKEQRCLYNISSLPQQESTIEGLLQNTISYLLEGLQYPDIAEAAITFGDEVYKTDDYCETAWQLSAESDRIEGKMLRIDIAYLKEKPTADEGPFLNEERQLLDSVVDTLSSQIERIISGQKLKESKNRWEKLVKNDPNLIMILVDREIKFINQAGAQILGASSPEQIMGEYLNDVVLPENMDLVEEREKKLMEGDSVGPVIHKVKSLDGKVHYVNTQSTAITYEGNKQAIQIVGQDVSDQIEYERELKESLKEKETLLQEIHHRVKNNLAVVSGMMDLQTFSTENEEVRRLLTDSKNRIKTMALIHEKLYQSSSLSKIDFGSYVEDLLENIKGVSATNKKIKVELEYDSFNLNVNQAVPCALIINEVAANAFEHAFTEQESGVIKVLLQKIDEKIVINIQDNGRGLPSDFEIRKSNSIGITIIETLIKQLEAERKVEDKNGLSFTFSFKKKEIKGSSSTLI
ncbi:PAS domain-containing sensor histidine kinase [Fodinibius sp. SL11]|uniref:PAS domain-containing sensor histidine kinase n=1 Tax=Fodinibius sp. SL11 TaxID=3425690 RepID=UPI003F8805D7